MIEQLRLNVIESKYNEEVMTDIWMESGFTASSWTFNIQFHCFICITSDTHTPQLFFWCKEQINWPVLYFPVSETNSHISHYQLQPLYWLYCTMVHISTKEIFHSCSQWEAQYLFTSQASVCNLLYWPGSLIQAWGEATSVRWRGNGYQGITSSMLECLYMRSETEIIHGVVWINCWVMLWRLSNCCVKPHHNQPVSFSIRLRCGGGEE